MSFVAASASGSASSRPPLMDSLPRETSSTLKLPPLGMHALSVSSYANRTAFGAREHDGKKRFFFTPQR